jgi:hypothetical protein
MDIAQIRRTNLLKLFSEFVAARQAEDPSASLAGMEKAFAEHIQIDNSYFSRLKTGGRQVNNKLVKQIEVLAKKPEGWLDEEHESEAPKGLTKFLELAEKAYMAAPGSRKDLMQAMKDAIGGARKGD